MTQDLISFLTEKPVDEMVQEVSLGGRLADFKFKIKPMNANQFYKYQQIATTIIGKTREAKFNSGRFNELVILNHVVEPNFKSADIISKAGVNTPEEFLNKFFLGGELIELSEEISKISGFNKSDAELEDEVKNS